MESAAPVPLPCLLSFPLQLPSGSALRLQGLLLRNAVLPSKQVVASGLAAPAPLAFNLSGSSSGSIGGSLVLEGCTVSTSCSNLDQFAAWVGGQLLQPSVNATQVQVGTPTHGCHCIWLGFD